MKNKRRMRRHWYFVVCVEMEAIVEADYPRTAEDSLHDVVHQMLDPIDRHHFPRVWCNLVGNVTPWPEMLTLCALVKAPPKIIKPRKETTLATSIRMLKRRKTVLP